MEKAIMCLVLAVSMVLVALAPPQAEAAISCGQVTNALSPCINYILYGGTGPAPTCCSGIRTLYGQARSTPDRQDVCKCLKSVANQATPTMISNAATLPGKCGVSIPYKISPSTDCASVH